MMAACAAFLFFLFFLDLFLGAVLRDGGARSDCAADCAVEVGGTAEELDELGRSSWSRSSWADKGSVGGVWKSAAEESESDSEPEPESDSESEPDWGDRRGGGWRRVASRTTKAVVGSGESGCAGAASRRTAEEGVRGEPNGRAERLDAPNLEAGVLGAAGVDGRSVKRTFLDELRCSPRGVVCLVTVGVWAVLAGVEVPEVDPWLTFLSHCFLWW